MDLILVIGSFQFGMIDGNFSHCLLLFQYLMNLGNNGKHMLFR
ncbi:Uncharacterised protein [Mycobacteroides abscessus subsp. abscessus]|nr:Uncharacterised protein [Mycobacteroides abscessus subsp. abscessus]